MKRLLALVLAALAVFTAGVAQACTVTPTVTANFGPFSPQSVRQGAVPEQTNRLGLVCPTGGLVLLGSNSIVGKFSSQNNLTLKNGSNSIAYTASAGPNGMFPFTQNGSVDYIKNNVLDLLGLLGTNADLPIYIKLTGATVPPVGVYTDKITMTWTWYLCTVNLLGACVGPNQGTNVTTVLDVKLTVSQKSVVLTTSTGTTWDPVNLTSNPKALPGGLRRMTVNVTNPDLVPVDNNTLGLNLPVPPGSSVALDGDGTASNAFVKFTDGTPVSNLAITYTAPGSTTDDVDFSSDRGLTWTFVPVPGDDVSQAAVTNIRLRPRGAMAAGSQFSLSISLKTK